MKVKMAKNFKEEVANSSEIQKLVYKAQQVLAIKSGIIFDDNTKVTLLSNGDIKIPTGVAGYANKVGSSIIHIGDLELGVALNSYIWKVLTDKQKIILLCHELFHIHQIISGEMDVYIQQNLVHYDFKGNIFKFDMDTALKSKDYIHFPWEKEVREAGYSLKLSFWQALKASYAQILNEQKEPISWKAYSVLLPKAD